MFSEDFAPDKVGSFKEFSSRFTELSEQEVLDLYGSALDKLREFRASQIGVTKAELHELNPTEQIISASGVS